MLKAMLNILRRRPVLYGVTFTQPLTLSQPHIAVINCTFRASGQPEA